MLNENSTALWGRMNIYQMVKHNILWGEMISGKTKYKQVFLGRLIGRMLLKNALKDGKVMPRNAPTAPGLIVSANGNVSAEKAKWIAQIEQLAHFSNSGFVHPFFGKMTIEQIGHHGYMHIDHHLRQFGC